MEFDAMAIDGGFRSVSTLVWVLEDDSEWFPEREFVAAGTQSRRHHDVGRRRQCRSHVRYGAVQGVPGPLGTHTAAPSTTLTSRTGRSVNAPSSRARNSESGPLGGATLTSSSAGGASGA